MFGLFVDFHFEELPQITQYIIPQVLSLWLNIVSVLVYHSVFSHTCPGGTTGTSLGEMQRNCSQTKAKPGASWSVRARVNRATLSSQFSPTRRNMRTWTARPRSPTLWSATRWGNAPSKLRLPRRIVGAVSHVFLNRSWSVVALKELLRPAVCWVVELLMFASSRTVNTTWVVVRGSTPWLTWWITTRRTPWWRKVGL